MLLLRIVQQQAELHALAGELAIGERAHAGEDRRQAGLRLAVEQRLARRAVGLPVADHLLEVGDQQVGGRRQILRRGGRNCRRCSWRCRSRCRGARRRRPGAVQVLAPEQELDGVIAGRDIGLDVAGLLQRARQELRRDLRGVDLRAVDLDRRVGDDVGGVERVLVGLGAVAAGRHSRSALRRAARNSRGLPSRRRSRCRSGRPRSADRAMRAAFQAVARRVQRVGRRLGDQRIDRLVEQLGGGQRILVFGERDVGIGRDHRLADRCPPWPAARKSPRSAPSRRQSRLPFRKAARGSVWWSSASPQ